MMSTVKIASQLLEQLSSSVKENPKTIATILAAGGLAGIGGGMASAGHEDPKESPMSRRLRILRNALLTGAAGAGAAGAGIYGYKQLANALPEGDTDPATGLFTSGFGRTLMGTGLGTAGWVAGSGKREREAAGLLALTQNASNKGSARETLDSLLKVDPNSGAPAAASNKSLMTLMSDLDLNKKLMRAGMDPLKYGLGNDYRFSDRLPFGLADKYQSGTKWVADKYNSSPMAGKINLEGVGKARKTISRAAYRHPVVAGLAAAGFLAPEVMDTASFLAKPVLPNPLHRE